MKILNSSQTVSNCSSHLSVKNSKHTIWRQKYKFCKMSKKLRPWKLAIWHWLKWKRMQKILSFGWEGLTIKVLKWRGVLLIGWLPWQICAFTNKTGFLILAKKWKQTVKRKRSLSFWICQNLSNSGTMKTCKFVNLIRSLIAKISVF